MLRENLDELEGREEKLFAEYASEFEVAKAQADSARASAAAASRGDSGGGLRGDGGLATRTLTGRQSVGESLSTAARATIPADKAAPALGADSSGSVTRRTLGSLAALSGGTGIQYLEYTAAKGGLEALREAEESEALNAVSQRASTKAKQAR